MPPIVILLLTLPVTAVVAFLILKRRPQWSRLRIVTTAAAPATAFILIYFVAIGPFRGSPDDWEGLTHVFAPVAGAILLGAQQLFGMTMAAIVVRMIRPSRGYIE